MAKETNRVLNETIEAFKKLKQEIKGYKDELATLTIGSEEWNTTAKKLANAQKQLDAINQAAKGNLAAYNKEQANSINELKAKIKVLNAERNAMDMNSKEYAEATKELKVLNDQLREAGTSAGDWKANVGNYANSLKSAFSDLGTAAGGLTGSIGGLNAGMMKLATNPVGAVVVALATAIKLLAEGIKSSEENTKKWNEAMIPLKTIFVMLQNVVQDVAGKFANFVKNLGESERTGKIVKGVLEALITAFNIIKTSISNMIGAVKESFTFIKNFVGKIDEWTQGLQKMFKPILDGVVKVSKAVWDLLQPAIEWIIKGYNEIANSWLGRRLGLIAIDQLKEIQKQSKETTDKVVQDFNEQKDAVTEATEATNKLNASLNSLMMAQAKMEGEVAAANRDYTAALEKEELTYKDLQDAQEALNRKKEAEIKLAKLGVAVAAAQRDEIAKNAKLTQNSAEANRALAQASAEVQRAMNGVAEAEANANKEQEKLNKKIAAFKAKEEARALKEAVNDLNIELDKYVTNYNKAIAAINNAERPEGRDITKDSLNAYYDEVVANAKREYDAYAAMQDAKIAKLDEWIAAQKAAGIDEKDLTTQIREAEKLRMEQLEGYPAQYKKMINAQNQADKERLKTLKSYNNGQIALYADLFDSVSGLFEQNTIAYKATATAKALINTYLAATGALADTPGGAVARGLAMAATLAAGIAEVVQIWKINPKGENSVSAGSSTPSVAEPVVSETNPYSYTRQVQTYQEEDQLNAPIYVKVTDINAVQERVKVVESESSY